MKTKNIVRVLATTAVLVVAGCGGDETQDAGPSETGTPTEEPADETEAPTEEATPPSDETEAPDETAAPDEAADQDEAADEDAAQPDEEADVQVDESSTIGIAETSLGTILVGGDGTTLYMFDPDEQGASTCYDECADNWPPVTVDGDTVGGESIDEEMLGTTEREDGSRQVTYNDWPLYRWIQDDEPGAVSGQGVEGVWWVVGPDGTPIRE